MSGLTVVTWLYGSKWDAVYAKRLFAGLRRNIKQPFRCALITDRDIKTGADVIVKVEPDELTAQPGCLVRMRLFDRAMQESLGVSAGDRIVNIDVDAVVTGSIDHLFERDDEFTIAQHFNTTNPCPFNGSLWMFRAGERHDVWDDFSLEAVSRIPFHAIPDDQAWLWHKFPNAAAYTPTDGVYAFKKRGWDKWGRRILPDDARLVVFPGRDPAKYKEVGWIKRHWLAV